MKNANDTFTTVPELRDQIFEEWYAAEWSAQENPAGSPWYRQPLNRLGYLISGLKKVRLTYKPAAIRQPALRRQDLKNQGQST